MTRLLFLVAAAVAFATVALPVLNQAALIVA
jgi:hypothetical protein